MSIENRVVRKVITHNPQISPPFKVVTYNVLAQKFCNRSKFEYQYNTKPEIMEFQHRFNNHLREIKEYDADILCFQEVQEDTFASHWKKELNDLGYDSIYKTNECTQIPNYGVATFWKRSKFQPEQDYNIAYKKLAQPILNTISDPRERANASDLFTKDQVALVTVFRSLSSPSGSLDNLLCVANTHIIANREAPQSKIYQVLKLFEGLRRVAQLRVPIIICGDFNSDYNSAPVDFIINRALSLDRLKLDDPKNYLTGENLSHAIHLDSVYPFPPKSTDIVEEFVSSSGQKITFAMPPNDNIPRYPRNDYIFFSDDLRLRSRLDDKEIQELKTKIKFPSLEYGADHFSLVAEFMFANPPLPHPRFPTSLW